MKKPVAKITRRIIEEVDEPESASNGNADVVGQFLYGSLVVLAAMLIFALFQGK